MPLTQRGSHGLTSPRSLLNRLIELPELARTIQALPAPAFAALVRKIGVEDAGELIALATTEQLVRAFDEDLFVSDRAGERETLDVSRFVVWLEVLLEAGDEVAAKRAAELDEDFVAQALSGLVLVLDEEALRARLEESDEDEARQVDKALESALMEDLDGYLVIAIQHDGWDAALSLLLAFDRDHRALLVRLLDRLARVGSRHLEDLDELTTVLSEGETLAEDVEAAREERRSEQGYVEPQAARAFLALARKPLEHGAHAAERDPLTRAYFRDMERRRHIALPVAEVSAPRSLRALPPALQRELDEATGELVGLSLAGGSERPTAMSAFIEALRTLSHADPQLFGERMEEFAYLVNVLIAGHERDGARLRPKEAADAALATACFGAVLALRAQRGRGARATRKAPPSATELSEVLRNRSVDALFRSGSSALASGAATTGVLYALEDLEAALR